MRDSDLSPSPAERAELAEPQMFEFEMCVRVMDLSSYYVALLSVAVSNLLQKQRRPRSNISLLLLMTLLDDGVLYCIMLHRFQG